MFSSLALYKLSPPSHFLFYSQVIFSLLHPSECQSFAHVSTSSPQLTFSCLIHSIPCLRPAPYHLAMFSCALLISPLQPQAAFAPIVCHLLAHMPPTTDVHLNQNHSNSKHVHMHTHDTWGLWSSRFLWGFKLVSHFFLFQFFFQSCAFAHPLNTHPNATLVHPTLAWPGDEAPTPSQGFNNNNNDNGLHTYRMHHLPMSVSACGVTALSIYQAFTQLSTT